MLPIGLTAASLAAPPVDHAQACVASSDCEEARCVQSPGRSVCEVVGLEALVSAPGLDLETLTTWAAAAKQASPRPPTHTGVLFVRGTEAIWSTSDPGSMSEHTSTWRDLSGQELLVTTAPSPNYPEVFPSLPALQGSRHRIERVARSHFLAQGYRAVEGVGDTRLAIELSAEPLVRLHLTAPPGSARFDVPREAFGTLRYQPGCPPPALVRAAAHPVGVLMLVQVPVAADVEDVHDAMLVMDGRGRCGQTHRLLVVGEDGLLRVGDASFPPVVD